MSEAATIGPQTSPAATPGPPSPVREWVVIGAVALIPPIAYLVSLGFAVLVALGGLVTLPFLFRDRKPVLGLAFLVALAAWALTSMNWTLFRQPGGGVSIEDLTALKLLLEAGLYGAFVSAALGISRQGGRRAVLVLTVALALLAALFLVEGIAGARIQFWIRAAAGQPADDISFAVRDVSRVAYALALLFWPVAVRLGQMKLRWAAAVMAAAILAGALLLGADAPAAALAVSAAVFFLVRWKGRAALWSCIGAVTVYFVAAPILAHLAPDSRAMASIPGLQSWAERLDIWRYAAARILERPFFGWGLDASRMFSPYIQLHTHNGALQLWLELGAVGAALALLFWVWLFGRIDRLLAADRTMAAASAATATVYLVIGALSFGVWQDWWMALGALAAAVCAAGVAARRAEPTAPEPASDLP
jgi:O-antigen ligase